MAHFSYLWSIFSTFLSRFGHFHPTLSTFHQDLMLIFLYLISFSSISPAILVTFLNIYFVFSLSIFSFFLFWLVCIAFGLLLFLFQSIFHSSHSICMQYASSKKVAAAFYVKAIISNVDFGVIVSGKMR